MSAADFDDPFDDPGYLEIIAADGTVDAAFPTAPVLSPADEDWLAGEPMDPAAEIPEPLPPLPGIPFCHRAAGVTLPGPTGGGRSTLVQVCAYDAAKHGLRVAYLGSEVTYGEFQARAAMIAETRHDTIDDKLRDQLARARYLDLSTVMGRAWANPKQWVASAIHAFDVIIGDPLSAIGAALGMDFGKNNTDYVAYYERLVQPYVTAGGTFITPDNLGHALEAQERAKGASAKQDRADLAFSCKRHDTPEGLLITAQKVRSIRAPFQRGNKWLFDRDTLTIASYTDDHQAAANTDEFRPTVLMERISRFVEDNPGTTSREIRTVDGKTKFKDIALRLLITEEYVRQDPDGARLAHHSLKPYREADDERACPKRAPQSVPPVPPRAPSVPQPCPDAPRDRAPRAYTKGTGHGHGAHPNTPPNDRTDDQIQALADRAKAMVR